MARKVPKSPFCPVVSCKTDKPHTDDLVVRTMLTYFDTPALIAWQALVGLTQLRDSMQDDLNSNRSFAFLARFRQIEELFHGMIYCLFAATPEERPHFLSEVPPNGFDYIYKLVNNRLCDGRLTLDTHVIQTVGLPDQKFMKLMHETLMFRCGLCRWHMTSAIVLRNSGSTPSCNSAFSFSLMSSMH
jgi:hypothetical protein